VERDREPVVAGAGGDDALAAGVGAQLQQQIGGAALLERARHLEVLELDEAARVRELRERLGVRARGLDDGVAQSQPRRLDGRDVDAVRVHQKGSAGSPRLGVIQPTGMSAVDCA